MWAWGSSAISAMRADGWRCSGRWYSPCAFGPGCGISSAYELAQPLGTCARHGVGQGWYRSLVGAAGERSCADSAHAVVLLFSAALAVARLRHGPRMAGHA